MSYKHYHHHHHGNKPSSMIDDHGFIFNSLIYIAIFTSIFLMTFLKPHRLYKNLISYIFNLKFKFHGAEWKVYYVLFLIIGFFSFILGIMKLQSNNFNTRIEGEPYDRKMYRLSQKWLIESEMWLAFLIIVELISICKLASMHDRRHEIASQLKLSSEDLKKLENSYELKGK